MSATPDPSAYGITEHGGGVRVRVYVAPRSSASKVVGEHNGALKVALTAPPVEGAANKALVELLSKLLGVPKGAVSIVSGETSRNKTVRVDGVAVDEAARLLLPDGDTA